jgi:hypothetical protein
VLATTVSKAEQRFDAFPRDFFNHLVKVLSNHRQNLALSGRRESDRGAGRSATVKPRARSTIAAITGNHR